MLNKVTICGVDTSKLPVISESELKGYFKKIYAGDKQAREDFIRGNLRLVLSIVQRFSMRGENLDDLFQIGCVGLIKAIDNFRLDLNVRFSTYACPMIIGEIRRYLRDSNMLRVSRSLKDTAYKAFQVRNELSKRDSEEPSLEKIASYMDMKPEDLAYALDAVQDPISLSQPVYQDDGDALYLLDGISDERSSDEIWLSSIALKDAVSKLGEREKNIIYLRYFDGKTQMEVSKEIGISQAQVSRLEKSAIKNMRKHYK